MTETTRGTRPAKSASKPSGQPVGLKIRRVNTTEGVHPYDQVTWELRDVVMTNWRDGSVNFEQRGVEFPDFWSMNATNIVASKYFRGALGSQTREHSLRQLLDRVVRTYAHAGREHGHFASEADAEIFEHELTWMLLHQVFSFNSPVWFNVGTAAPQQVSACFILSVDDTMDSILNWYREEGLIFKGGSGAGLNLSRIRSSKELLSSGGNASGPVSFMRGADASAGTIKSGGATRRAAKMVVLDVDHPDVAEFVETKAREENKIRALRDAGFDMDLGGRDIVSVQYQNANNSVRVSDEFMRAVVDGTEFGLRARLDNRVIETVDARELFGSIAQAAWECADPGIQYDDTINDWHTCPESGRITASNPCSEYLSLDNSSCNLASLNLMKFLRPDRTFDVDGFVAAVELIITAMDISICFADFPTPEITRVTRAYRQLGIGYANLGALLMATGHAYDSEGGRALAAAITSLMTATAYRRSAELAGVVGAYEGFARNAAAHRRVMRKHAAANDAVRTVNAEDARLLAAAGEQWQRALAEGERHGWRNAQASLLAPTGTIGLAMDCDTTGIEPDLALVKMKKLVGGASMKIVNQTVPAALRCLGYTEETTEAIVEYITEHGHVVGAPGLRREHYEVFDCAIGDRAISPMGHVRMMASVQPFLSGAISKCVTGDTLVTTDHGLIRIDSLHRGEAPDSFRDEIIQVASLDGPAKTSAFYYGGVRDTRKVVLRSGHQIVGTPNHRVLVAGQHGTTWRYLSDIRAGEYVAVRYGVDQWSTLPARFDDFRPTPRYGPQKLVTVPREMTEELAFLLGAFTAEGRTTRSTWTIYITNSIPEACGRVADAWRTLFGVVPRLDTDANKCSNVVVSSKTIVEFFDYLGMGERASEKRIPDAVLRSPRNMVCAFLSGLHLDAYTTSGTSSKLALCTDSPKLLDDYQAVLSNLGVVTGRISKWNNDYGKYYDEVYATGRHARRLVELAPFVEPYKAARAELIRCGQSTADVVPGVIGRELYNLLPRGQYSRNGRTASKAVAWRQLLDKRTKNVSWALVEEVVRHLGDNAPDWLSQVIRGNLHFSPVEAVSDAGEREVYDLAVPGTNAFVGNGIVNHNTVNMPATATVKDVEQIYLEGWRLGLKALAIYRDNCKVGQPLTDVKGAKAAARADAAGEGAAVSALPAGEFRPVRRRLPKIRPSRTLSFSVGGAEGYMTAGSYPDDGLGEIFIKMSKQGSTLAGVMDAFSIAISIALQYGVPLETYVSKFINMRFDPAGMTDDPDVRIAQSVMDYLFRRLALDYLSEDERAELGVFTAEERARHLSAAYGSSPAAAGEETELDIESLRSSAPVEHAHPADAAPEERPADGAGRGVGGTGSGGTGSGGGSGLAAVPTGGAHAAQRRRVELAGAMPGQAMSAQTAVDAPLCFTCGVTMRSAGSCYVCEQCGSTSGCS